MISQAGPNGTVRKYATQHCMIMATAAADTGTTCPSMALPLVESHLRYQTHSTLVLVLPWNRFRRLPCPYLACDACSKQLPKRL